MIIVMMGKLHDDDDDDDDIKMFMMTVTQNMIEEINNDNIKDYIDDDNDDK